MEPYLAMYFVTMKIIWLFLWPFFWIASLSEKKKAPPISNKLLLLSATSLAEKIRKREIRSAEITNAYIQRIKIVNPIINAIVEERFNEALQEAKAVDTYLENTKDLETIKSKQPLLGVPFTVKESCGLNAMTFSVGAKLRLHLKASKDGEAVRLLREAGAIPLLVSNTPELCLYWETNNLITGRTNNPYDSRRSAGGSSGGEGALLASGASVIGIGSDVAGSIRLPSLYNGVFGHKPTSYITSNEGHMPNSNNKIIQSSLVIGPLTRYAEDLPLMMEIMAGKNSDKLKLHENVKLSDLNVFYMKELGKSLINKPVHSDIKELIEKSVQYLQNHCKCKVIKKTFNVKNSLPAASVLLLSDGDIPRILKTEKIKNSLLVELFKSFFGCSNFSRNGLFVSLLDSMNGFVPKRRHDFYGKEIEDLKKDFVDSLGENGVFLIPTFHTAAIQHNKFLFESSGLGYLSLFNILGFPSTHIPMGLNSKGLPIGFQVAAAPNQDKLCFAIAKELEKAFGGWVEPS